MWRFVSQKSEVGGLVRFKVTQVRVKVTQVRVKVTQVRVKVTPYYSRG